MAKATLLEMTQEILSDMNSDTVNSISDTVEAMQVATIIKRTFLNMANERLWPAYKRLLKLVPYGDGSRPNYMKFDEAVIQVDWVKYDSRDSLTGAEDYLTVAYVQPDEFIERVMARDPDGDNVETVIDPHGTPVFIFNDQAPTFYTSFDDETLVFDSYNKAVESTLMASKTQAYGEVEPEFQMADGFVPAMPVKYFPYLINEAKSTCFIKIKEVFSQKDEQNAQRQKAWLARHKNRAQPHGMRYPDYGRKRGGSGRYSRAGYRNDKFTG